MNPDKKNYLKVFLSAFIRVNQRRMFLAVRSDLSSRTFLIKYDQ